MTTLKTGLLSYAFASSEVSTLLLKFEDHPEGLQHCLMQQSSGNATLWQSARRGPCLQCLPKHPAFAPPEGQRLAPIIGLISGESFSGGVGGHLNSPASACFRLFQVFGVSASLVAAA